MDESFSELTREVSSVLSESATRSYWPRQDKLISIISRYSDYGRMRNILKTVYDDQHLMTACLEQSQVHPLGFDIIVLAASPDYEIDLHIWWNSGLGREDIHNHRFSFASGVVIGSLRMSSYRLGGAGVPMAKIKEEKDSKDTYEYHVIGQVNVRKVNTVVVRPGGAYYLDAGELHNVEAGGDTITATLFIRTRQERRNTVILMDGDSERIPQAGSRQYFSASGLREKIRFFGEVCDSNFRHR